MQRTSSALIALVLLAAPGFAAQTDKPATPAATATESATKPEMLTSEQRGDIYMARKMYREAIEQYREMPQSSVILNKIGIAYHQLMDLGTAKRYYSKSVKANPKYAEAVNNLGTVFYATKNYGRATRQYQEALKLNPLSASIYSNLGTAFFARKRYKEAFEAYHEALKLDPEVFEYKSSYGVLMQERTVEERAKLHYYLAKLYAQSGLNDRAISYIRRAMEEGFKDTKKFMEEPEFSKLRELPEFQQLMAQQPRAL
jgi:tetratricopeptide (TPR) repeat protein